MEQSRMPHLVSFFMKRKLTLLKKYYVLGTVQNAFHIGYCLSNLGITLRRVDNIVPILQIRKPEFRKVKTLTRIKHQRLIKANI